jgi:hypothetical protein
MSDYGHAALLASRCANGCPKPAPFTDKRQRQVCGTCALADEEEQANSRAAEPVTA